MAAARLGTGSASQRGVARSHSSCQLCRVGACQPGVPQLLPGPGKGAALSAAHPGSRAPEGSRRARAGPQPLPRWPGRHRPGPRHQQHPRTFAPVRTGFQGVPPAPPSSAGRLGGTGAPGQRRSSPCPAAEAAPCGTGLGPGARRARVRASLPPHLRHSVRRYLQQDLLLA